MPVSRDNSLTPAPKERAYLNTWLIPVPLVFRVCLAIYSTRKLLNDGKCYKHILIKPN